MDLESVEVGYFFNSALLGRILLSFILSLAPCPGYELGLDSWRAHTLITVRDCDLKSAHRVFGKNHSFAGEFSCLLLSIQDIF